MLKLQVRPYVLWITVIVVLTLSSCRTYRQPDLWEHVSVRFGFWVSVPPYQHLATAVGYVRLNDVCKTDYYHGFLFSKDGNRKPMPLYDLNGNLAGVQLTIPGNIRGFNSRNMTIPVPGDVGPPVLRAYTDSKGVPQYTVTAYFKHPSLLCSPLVPEGVDPRRGLYIQMGFSPVSNHMHVPLNSRDLSPLWIPGNCRPQMGTHYFMNLSRTMSCEKLYPLFLLYDMEGNLGAFGWLFQGRPNNFQVDDGFYVTPDTYPLIFDTNMLPPCMFNEQFKVFGIHVYLRNSTRLICTSDIPSNSASHNIDTNSDTIQILFDGDDGHKNANDQDHLGSKSHKDKMVPNNVSSASNCASAHVLDISWMVFTSLILLFMTAAR